MNVVRPPPLPLRRRLWICYGAGNGPRSSPTGGWRDHN